MIFSLALLVVVVVVVVVVVFRVLLDESISSLVLLVTVESSSRIFRIRSRLCLRFSSRSKRNVSISIFLISKR